MPNYITNNAMPYQYTCKTDGLYVNRPLIPDVSKKSKQYVINPPSELLFKASDGKIYDLKDVARNKLSKLEEEVSRYMDTKLGFIDRIIQKAKNFLGLSNNSEQLLLKLYNYMDIVEKADNIERLFEDLTGAKYSQENLNKFLKNQINLKISKEFTKITSEKEPTGEIAPQIDEKYYINQNKKQNIKLNKNEQNLYNNIAKKLDDNYKQKLSILLSQGRLTLKDNQNQTMILESLNKIITTPRSEGIDGIKVLKECIDILENPSIITQYAEDIPNEYLNQYAEKIYNDNKDKIEEEWREEERHIASYTSNKTKEKADINELKEYITRKLTSRNIGTCAAASIEYDFATQHPADFLKMAETVTSQNPTTSLTVKFDDSTDDFRLKMKTFKTNYQIVDNNTAKIILKPDKDALELAKIQNNHKDSNERSMIDILIQSVIMNLGSGGTYNSLLDTREKSVFTQDNSGLCAQEVQFAREIISGTPVFNINYQIPKGKGFEFIKSKDKIKQDISDALKHGENIVIGYIFENDEFGYSGHEITIIGQTKNINGKNYYICQDSDNNKSTPQTISEDFILSHIHHASFCDKDYIKSKKSQEELIKTVQINQSSLITELNMNQVYVIGNNIITPWKRQQPSAPFNPIMQNQFKPVNTAIVNK